MSASLPIIGITAHRYPAGDKFRLEPALAIPSGYCDGVSRAGGLPAVLAPVDLDDAAAETVMAALDGLLLTGGPDVVPARYGQDAVPETYGVSELQDDYEVALLQAALRLGRPVLCICRGLQVLNVALGGTLNQHITGEPGLGPHGVPNGGGGSDNGYIVTAGSLLAAVMGTEAPHGRCHHHQAVDVVAPGLIVTARTDDGTVEGLERDGDGSWLLAVQWHPEETAPDDPANQALFDHLVAAAGH